MLQPELAKSSRPRLLVSVRSAAEARDAWRGGADIIDVKEPSAGPLGSASVEILDELFDLPEPQQFSLALGELENWDHPSNDGLRRLIASRSSKIRFLKIGLANLADRSDWITPWQAWADWCMQAAPGIEPVLVGYADGHRVNAPSLDEVMAWGINSRANTFLIDTAVKDGQRLDHWLFETDYRRWSRQLRRAGMKLALAGSLDVEPTMQGGWMDPLPDIIAVRSSACVAGLRSNPIDRRRVARLKIWCQSGVVSTP